jgi:hypothetical protein
MQKVELVYATMKFMVYLFYFLTFISINIYIPNFLHYLPTIVTIFICILLIIRFNPFSTYNNFTAFDKKIIFEASTFLLVSTLISHGYLLFVASFQNKFLQKTL